MAEKTLGFAFLVLLVLYVAGFALWNMWGRRQPPRRMAELDSDMLLTGGAKRRKQFASEVVPVMAVTIAGFTAAAAAGLFVIIALLFDRPTDPTPQIDSLIINLGLGGIGVSVVCWLIALEQMSEMVGLSTPTDTMLKLYRSTLDLWIIGLTLTIVTIPLFLLLVSPFVGVLVGLLAVTLTMRYWRIINGW